MSLAKNLKAITSLAPRPIVTWDKAERIRRNEEIWANPESIVHRLPEHYKVRYWNSLLKDAAPVHYRVPNSRYFWDPKRNTQVEAEVNPIIGVHPPEADQGLWGGEGIVKGWIESRPYTKKKVLHRNWVPRLFFPYLKCSVFYSEILDQYLQITVTERACRLIDEAHGLDYYILDTPELDLRSKLGNKLKQEMLLRLANEDYFPEDEDKRAYIKEKYAKYKIPAEEAEWVGLDINEAARKQQLLEESIQPEPLKFKYEQELVEKLKKGVDITSNEEEYVRKTEESKFGEKLLGKYMNPLAKKLKG
ncbi:unnamed protein product [Auanema sp. JU1783]|nr:unnamed protein product [Auanema sp. JU1783]